MLNKNLIQVSIVLFMALTSFTPNNDMVLFSSSRNGNSDIYLMDSDGKNLRQLTNDIAEEWGAVWINSQEISFLRQVGDKITIHRLNLMTKQESLISHPVNCYLDDKNILYSQKTNLQLYTCKGDIFIFNPEDETVKNITNNIDGTSLYPTWGPNAESILFTNNQSGTNDIYQMNLNSGQLKQITSSSSNEERAEISPDGQFMVYSSDKLESGNQELLLLNLESGTSLNISKSEGTELIARFSSDSKRIYYGSNKDGNWEIYSYDLKSATTKKLTHHEGFDGDPRIFYK